MAWPRPRIYLSVTGDDLRQCAEALSDWLKGMDMIPVRSDGTLLDAEDNPAEILRTTVTSCDVVIHVVGYARGGALRQNQDAAEGRTLAQMEFDMAVEENMPVHVFIGAADFFFQEAPESPEEVRDSWPGPFVFVTDAAALLEKGQIFHDMTQLKDDILERLADWEQERVNRLDRPPIRVGTPVDEAEAAASPTYPPEDVQYTVYRPRELPVEQWHPLLVFAHLSERRPEEDPAAPDPLSQLEKDAADILGDKLKQYQPMTSEGSVPIPREGEITLVPKADGIDFNPPRHSFIWTESVHRAEFRVRARAASAGLNLRGTLTVYCGAIVVAEIALRFQVVATASQPVPLAPPVYALPYRKIFASYSRLDLPIVRQFEKYAKAIGDSYLRDLVDIRAGEVWDERLKQMIEEAHVFQLFWSHHSMSSEFVAMEWNHALTLNRDRFVRPTYWDEKLPESTDPVLPPESLKRLHFVRIAFGPQEPEPAPKKTTAGGEDDLFWLGNRCVSDQDGGHTRERISPRRPPLVGPSRTEPETWSPARTATPDMVSPSLRPPPPARETTSVMPAPYVEASSPRSISLLVIAALMLLGVVLTFGLWLVMGANNHKQSFPAPTSNGPDVTSPGPGKSN